jgi:hypothetical protein
VAGSAAGYLRVDRDVPAAGVDDLIRAEAARPFDVERGPLLRCVVYAVADGSHRVQLTIHHLVCDGWSMKLLLDELSAGYRAARQGLPYAPEPVPIQYPEYAAQQCHRLASGEYAESIAHWAESLRGAPQLLALPADLPRPAVQTTAGGVETVVLPAATHDRLIQLTRQYGVTPFMAAFASFAVFLGRICRQRDLIVGLPVSGREEVDLHGTVGMLTNTLPLRVDLSGEPAFADVLAQVRAVRSRRRGGDGGARAEPRPAGPGDVLLRHHADRARPGGGPDRADRLAGRGRQVRPGAVHGEVER